MKQLSPGRYHQFVHCDPVENLKQRLDLIDLADANHGVQQELMAMCKDDVIFWINLFVMQYNPNFIAGGSSMEEGPFITWEYQIGAIYTILEWIDNRQDGVIEKSREMGASVFCLLICLWLFLFHRNKKFLVVSRNADAVDKADEPDSLFWKLRFAIHNLPPWMTRGRVVSKTMRLKNPLLNSYITGQATTGKMGVGGRATAMFLDEFSQNDDDREVFARTRHTSSCRIFNGTHVGTETMFYEMCDPSSAVYNYIQHLQIHWTQHPDKVKGKYEFDPLKPSQAKVIDKQYAYPDGFKFVLDGRPSGGFAPGVRSPWYDKISEGMSQSAIAMDLDIDAHASTSLFFEPVLIRELVAGAKSPVWTGSLTFERETGKPKELNRGQGNLALWINPKLDGDMVPFGKYTIAADICFGTGKTPSCASIFDAKLSRKVGMFVDPWIEPADFALYCVALCYLFAEESGTGALLGWDGHGPCGSQFKNKVMQLGYRNIWYNRNEKSLFEKVSEEPGMFFGNSKHKAGLLMEYQLALKKRILLNQDGLSLEECLAFMHDGKGGAIHKKEKSTDDPAGAGENHADRAFADALNWRLAKEWAEGGTRREAEAKSAIQPGSLDWLLALQNARHRQLEEAW